MSSCRGLVVCIVLLCLTGCAAQIAHREGQSLIASGEKSRGIRKLEEATLLDPTSAEFRAVYLRMRDVYGEELIVKGDAAQGASQYESAEKYYSEAIALRSRSDRAIEGLRKLERRKYWDRVLVDIETALKNKNWKLAGAKARMILAEDPHNEAARRLTDIINIGTADSVSMPVLADAFKLPITIEFRDAPLRSIFEVVSRTSRLNFVFDKDVKTDQRSSIYVRNTSIENALSWILVTNQLDMRVLNEGSVLIYPANSAKQLEYLPLVVRSFYLSNADAKTVAATLKAVLKTKDIVVDEKLNLLIMRDRIEAIELAQKLVNLHEVPEPEVMLEVEILEVKRDRLLDLGIRWPDRATLSLLPTMSGRSVTVDDLRGLGSEQVGLNVGSASVSLQKRDLNTNILANPRIRTRNKEKAKIMIGERLPNITTTSSATGFIGESITYVDVGLKLEVEPTIYLDGEVAIKVALEVSSITSQQTTKAGSLAYQLGTRNAQTVLRLKDGENQVLAGLINNEERSTANKIPGFGDVPFIGRLFGGTAEDATKSEIVLSITPRILRNVQRPSLEAVEFDSGTENNLRKWNFGQKQVGEEGANPRPDNSQGLVSPVAPTDKGVMGAEQAVPLASFPTTNQLKQTGISPVGRWEGPTRSRPGEIITLQFVVQSDRGVSEGLATVDFDPAVFQLEELIEGGFLKKGGVDTKFTQRTVSNGRVDVFVSQVAGGNEAKSPDSFFTLKLRPLKGATTAKTEVFLKSLILKDRQGNSNGPSSVYSHAIRIAD